MTAPVAVVGLGPVGAALALLLARAGVPCLAIERDAEAFALSRAIALDDEALRVLQAAGLPAPAAPEFSTRQTVRFRSRHGDPLVDLPPRLSMNGHPSLAFFHQPGLERALRAELARQPLVTLLLGAEVEGVEQDGERVTLGLRDVASGERRSVAAVWVVGCDGGRSLVRRQAGIRLRGITSRRRWLVVDTQQAGEPDAPFEFLCDPRRPTVAAPLPQGRRRWEFMLVPGEDPRAMERPGAVRRLLAPYADPAALEVVRATVYTFHARVAERWRDRRVLLAGDAAHLSPPFAGQGLSTGLGDVHALAWRLAAVVGGAPEALLDSYEAERRGHVARLIALAVALGLVIQTRRPRVAAVRDGVAGRLLAVPAVRRFVQEGGWKPPAVYRRGFVLRGGAPLLPQPVVGDEPLDELLGPGFALVACGADPAAAVAAWDASPLGMLPLEVVRLARDEPVLGEWLAARGGTLALVRPDRHVLAVFTPDEAVAVMRTVGGRL